MEGSENLGQRLLPPPGGAICAFWLSPSEPCGPEMLEAPGDRPFWVQLQPERPARPRLGVAVVLGDLRGLTVAIALTLLRRHVH